jgi:pimeloyl-ACP methyl ester carboxylesterase
LEQIVLIGYSLGGQIAYRTAQELAGSLFVDKLVTIGAPYLAYNGLRNIGELWELWGEYDLTGIPGNGLSYGQS